MTMSVSPRTPPGSEKVTERVGACRMMKSGVLAVKGTKMTDTWAAVTAPVKIS